MLKRLKFTQSPYLAIGGFSLVNAVIYATSAAKLTTLSQMSVLLLDKSWLHTYTSSYSMTFLAIMLFFPFSALLLRFNRGRLPRNPVATLSRVIVTLALAVILIAGNAAISPIALG
jgi:hypothetical protein